MLHHRRIYFSQVVAPARQRNIMGERSWWTFTIRIHGRFVVCIIASIRLLLLLLLLFDEELKQARSTGVIIK
jgi:hypothetical protein